MSVSVRSAEITLPSYRAAWHPTSRTLNGLTAAARALHFKRFGPLASAAIKAQHAGMKKLHFAAIAVVLAASNTAFAGGGEGLGVGGEAQINGLVGPSVNYDTGKFHAGGLLAFRDLPGDNNTTLGIGGRFFWHLHSTASADFSIGGQLGLIHGPDNVPVTNDNINELYLEPAFQIRAFITPNVALSFTGGLSIGLADADGIGLTSQVTGAAGVHYYFF